VQNAGIQSGALAVYFEPQRSSLSAWKDDKLAKPNYQYEKRQKDLAKKKKQEEKRLRKLEKNAVPAVDNPDQTPTPVPAPDTGETS
jgi:hypothetical protein